MTLTLIAATTAISLALVCYTAGVFSERKRGTLTKGSLALFWLGLALDTTGTTLMTVMAQDGGAVLGMHAASGALAIALMAVHAIWATVTFARKNEVGMKRFHTFSVVVWLFWLMPYVLGVLQGIPVLHLQNLHAGIGSLAVAGIAALIVLRKPATKRPSAR